MHAPGPDNSGSDIRFSVTRKANFFFGVMQHHNGVSAYGEMLKRSLPINIRGALLDKVVMTDAQSHASTECYALEPPLGNYLLQHGQAQRVKGYPVIAPGTYDVVFNPATHEVGPPTTPAEQAAGFKNRYRTFWIKTGTDTLFHWGEFPEWSDGCVTLGQKPQLVVRKDKTDAAGRPLSCTVYDHFEKGGINPALPAPESQTEDKQQGLLSIARMTVRLRDREATLDAMLRIYDDWKLRNGGREPHMKAVVTSPDKVPHYDLNDPLQCPMGRDFSL